MLAERLMLRPSARRLPQQVHRAVASNALGDEHARQVVSVGEAVVASPDLAVLDPVALRAQVEAGEFAVAAELRLGFAHTGPRSSVTPRGGGRELVCDLMPRGGGWYGLTD